MAQYSLSKEETLELRNVSLRRALLESQVRLEESSIQAEHVAAERAIASRLGLGDRLSGSAKIDLQKGIVTVEDKEDSEPAKEAADLS